MPLSRAVLAATTALSLLLPSFALATTDIDPADFPWNLEEGLTEAVRFSLPKVVFTMGWMEVEKDGDDSVTISFPAIEVQKPKGGEPLDGKFFSTATRLTFTRDGGKKVAFKGEAEEIFFAVDGPSEAKPNRASVLMTVDAPTVTFNLDGLDKLYVDGKTPFDLSGDEMGAVLVTTNTRFDLTYDSMQFTTEPAKNRDISRLSYDTGPSSMTIAIRDSRLEMASTSDDMTMRVEGPVPMDLSADTVASALEMPTDASPDPQEMTMKVKANGIEMDDSIWNWFDPKKVLPRSLDAFLADFSMVGIFTVSPFDKEAREQAKADGAQPILPTRMAINALEFDGFGLDVEGSGAVELDGKKPSSLDAFLSVAGLSEFMVAMQAADLLKPPQAVMIEGMANQLGKEADDGALTFDVTMKDSMLLVNDAPVAPIPQK